MGGAKIFLKYYINSISCASVRAQLIFQDNAKLKKMATIQFTWIVEMSSRCWGAIPEVTMA